MTFSKRDRYHQELKKILAAFLSPFYLKKEKVLLKPNFISLEVEKGCCLRCQQCDIWKRPIRDRGKGMSLEEIRKLINDLADWLGFYQLNLTGGEPLLAKNLEKIVSIAAKKGIFVHLNTNAFLLSKAKVASLLKSGIGSISLSLDSPFAKEHDFLRGKKGSYKRLMEAARELKKQRGRRDVFISLTTVISGRNIKDLEKIVALAEKWGLDGVFFQPIWHNFGAEKYDRNWFEKSSLWPRDYGVVKNSLQELKKLKKRGGLVLNSLAELEAYLEYFKDPFLFGERRNCYVGVNSFNVDLDGEVRFCFDFESVGNVTKELVKEIWNNEKAAKLRLRIAACSRGCRVLLCNMPMSKRKAANLLLRFTKLRIKRFLGRG